MKIDAEILLSCRNGDRKGQEQLYKLCYTPLMKHLYRYIYDPTDAADVLNRAMFKTLTRIEQFSGNGDNFFGWIKRIVTNEAIDYLRAKPNFYATDELDKVVQQTGFSEIENEEVNEELTQLLSQLPGLSAAVFSMYALEGYSHKEIAESLSISIPNSKWHLFNARKKLQQIVGVKSEAK